MRRLHLLLSVVLLALPLVAAAQANGAVTATVTQVYQKQGNAPPTIDIVRSRSVSPQESLLVAGDGTVSDDLAQALIESNPNRFQEVPPSDYVQGIDY